MVLQHRKKLKLPVRLHDVPYSKLALLSEILIKHGGTHYRLPASSGPMAHAVDVVCEFGSGEAQLLFKLEWPA